MRRKLTGHAFCIVALAVAPFPPDADPSPDERLAAWVAADPGRWHLYHPSWSDKSYHCVTLYEQGGTEEKGTAYLIHWQGIGRSRSQAILAALKRVQDRQPRGVERQVHMVPGLLP